MSVPGRGFYPELPIKDRPKRGELWRRVRRDPAYPVVVRILDVWVRGRAHGGDPMLDVIWEHVRDVPGRAFPKTGGGVADLAYFMKSYERIDLPVAP